MQLTDIAAYAAVLALVALDIWARAERNRILLGIPTGTCARINMMGDAIAYVTPGRLGGEPLRFFGFLRAGATAPAVLAAFAIEFLIDAVLLVVVGVLLAVAFRAEGADWLARLVVLLRSPTARLVAMLTIVAALISVLVAKRMSGRLPARWVRTLIDALHAVRITPPNVLAGATLTTMVSIAARTAILPVLAPKVAGLSLGGVTLASYVLMYGQMMLPTPAGAGGVELGFIAGFQTALDAEARTALIALWRFYTLVVPVVAGALLMARAGLLRRGAVAAALKARAEAAKKQAEG